MAFFGITNFGPQNTFAKACSKQAHIHIFKESDLRQSWIVVTKDIKNPANKNKIDAILMNLYNGHLPDADQVLIYDGFNELLANDDSFITYIQFLSTMKRLQAENEAVIRTKEDRSLKCAEPSLSNHTYRNKVKAHIVQTDYKAKQRNPLSSSQEVGWENAEYKTPVAGKQSSEITKFAAELVKNGIYY